MQVRGRDGGLGADISSQRTDAGGFSVEALGYERAQVPTTRVPGRSARPRASGTDGNQACARAAGETGGSEDAQSDGLGRGVPLFALRQSPRAARRIRQPVFALRRRPSQLHSVHVVRHERALRVHAIDCRPRRAEGREKPLYVVHGTHDGRASNRHAGSHHRASGVRRSIQIISTLVAQVFRPAHTTCHNQLMALISPSDQQKLRESFEAMTGPVRLLFFTQTLDCDTCPQTRQILDELPSLSDKISIEEINIVLDSDKAKQYGIDRVPAIAIVGQDGSGAERDSKIRFLGTPAGYEFISLVQAVLLVGGSGSNLSTKNRQRIAAVDKPVTMQVFTTPT